MTPKIIFESPHFTVVDKEPGVLTVPSRMGKEDVRPCLGYQLQEQYKKQIYPVHRLDFEVSGLVLFALDAKAHAVANSWFENREVKKIYEAWTEPGQVLSDGQSFTWKSKLLRGKKRTYTSPHGKHSITEVTFLGTHPKNAWAHWQLNPVTGRPHQLRFELANHGWPIVGDKLYGATSTWQGEGILLRAQQIDFSLIEESKRFGLPATIKVEPLPIYSK